MHPKAGLDSAAISDVTDTRQARAGLLLLAAPIVGATFVSKLAIPGFNVDGISFGFPLIYIAILYGAYRGGLLALEWSRLTAFCLMGGVLGAASALGSARVSVPSVMLLMLLHLPYVLHIEGTDATRERMLRLFLNIALIIGLCGLGQYLLQSVLPIAWVFPIENLLPADLRVTGFNMQIPISYGATVYRPNGIFMQEPSFFSQFLAIAIIAELVAFNRLWRVLLLGLAIITSQSGTGLIILAVCLPLLMVAYRRGDLFVLAIVGVLALLVAAPVLHLDTLFARVGEFGSTKSSGYERFVGGFHIFEAALGSDPLRALFGYGAGAYREVVQSLGHPAAEMALFKIVVEFGVIGALCYFGFIFFCIFGAQGPLVVRLALAICLFLNGAYNTFVHSLALSLLVWSSSISHQPLAAWAKSAGEKHRDDELNRWRADQHGRNGRAMPGDLAGGAA